MTTVNRQSLGSPVSVSSPLELGVHRRRHTLHSRQQVGVISSRQGALLQPLGSALGCCARN
ncbi:hypothetical protein LSAT2_030090, partial [Lamellibrachia satsuma]